MAEEGLNMDDSQLVREKLPIEEDESVKGKKDMKISVNIYTVTYFALLKKNKKQFKMTESD